MGEDILVKQHNTDEFDDDYRFGFNGQQKENNLKGIGNHNTAMFWEYDTRLGRRWNIDPVDQVSISNYSAFRNSPIWFVDPFGNVAGEFVDDKGKVIGNDGKNDGKAYALKTTEKSFGEGKAAVPGAGISGMTLKQAKDFIKANSGNTQAFDENPIAYDNSVEIPGDMGVRQQLFSNMSNDDGRGGEAPSNNREYATTIMTDGSAVNLPPGEVADPSVSNAHTSRFLDNDQVSIFGHSHPSGTKTVFPERKPGVVYSSEGAQTSSFGQPPSPHDVSTAGKRTNIVFGMGNKTVYIYNSKGVQATIPMYRFVKFKR